MAAVATAAAIAAAGGAEAAHDCVAPHVIGVNLSMARHALEASGCEVAVRQLPAHGSFVTPATADGRQVVARQRPETGGHAQAVTVWVEPLCAQPAQPGPPRRGPLVESGPTRLIAGLYLRGGPVQTSPHCRRGLPEAGTVVVSTSAGKVLARRQVRAGNFGVFPLAPGSYLLGGTVTGGAAAGHPLQVAQTAVRIAARRTTRLNMVADLP